MFTLFNLVVNSSKVQLLFDNSFSEYIAFHLLNGFHLCDVVRTNKLNIHTTTITFPFATCSSSKFCLCITADHYCQFLLAYIFGVRPEVSRRCKTTHTYLCYYIFYGSCKSAVHYYAAVMYLHKVSANNMTHSSSIYTMNIWRCY